MQKVLLAKWKRKTQKTPPQMDSDLVFGCLQPNQISAAPSPLRHRCQTPTRCTAQDGDTVEPNRDDRQAPLLVWSVPLAGNERQPTSATSCNDQGRGCGTRNTKRGEIRISQSGRQHLCGPETDFDHGSSSPAVPYCGPGCSFRVVHKI